MIRVLAWPRSPSKITSWPARMAFSSWGTTVSSKPSTPVDQRLARGDARRGVASDLVGDRDRLPPRRPELARGSVGRSGAGSGGCDCAVVGHGGRAYAAWVVPGPTLRARGIDGGPAPARVRHSPHARSGGKMGRSPPGRRRGRRARTRRGVEGRRRDDGGERNGHPRRRSDGPRRPDVRHCAGTAGGSSRPSPSTVLIAFVVLRTWAAFANKDYYVGASPHRDLISPFYSPCIAQAAPGPHAGTVISLVDASPRRC